MTVALGNPRTILGEFIREQMGANDELRLDDLRRLARERFADDSAFRTLATNELIDHLVQEIGVRERVAGRNAVIRDARADGPAHRRDVEEIHRGPLAEWWESVGAGRSKRLEEMTRPELRHAIGERQTRIDGEQRRVGFLEALAKGMKNDVSTVAETYTERRQLALRRKYLGED